MIHVDFWWVLTDQPEGRIIWKCRIRSIHARKLIRSCVGSMNHALLLNPRKDLIMATTVETFQKIEKKAAESAPFTRKIVNMEIGDVIRQGDVYIERVEKIAPGKETGRQLA